KEKDTSFIFDADNYYDLQEANQNNTPFNNNYHLKKDYPLKKYFWKYAWFFFTKRFLTPYLLVKTVGTKKQLSNFISIFFNGYITQQEFLSNKNYNIYHFHFLRFTYIKQLFFLPPTKKVIVSIWGSDLLRINNVVEFYFQQKAL